MAEAQKNITEQQQDFQTATIIVTKKAVKRLKAVMNSEGKEDHVLRMSVEGGGCSGMSYKMDFDKTQGDFDKVFETNDLKVVCDLKSWPGGKGTGKGAAGVWKTCFKIYGFKNEKEALDYKKNPLDHAKALAEAIMEMNMP